MQPLSRAAAATEKLRRLTARRSLLAFAEYTHPRWTTGAHHRKVCAFLERIERGEIKRGMIFAPPRHAKSELASRRFPAWYLGRNSDKQLITATYAADFAVDFGADVRGIIRSAECQRIFPGLDLHHEHTAASRWRTTKGGIYVATGVGGPITGRGAHLGLIDDPFKNREEADSMKKRERVWRWFNSTFYTRLMPDGVIVIMMTRWHDDDLAGRLLKQGGWDVLELPAIANEHTDHEEALWPEWYPLEELHEKRSKLPAREWSALYQQRPTNDSGTYCKREWFSDVYDTAPKEVRKYLVSDLAVTEAKSDDESRGPDYTEHGLVGIAADDHAYALDWWYGRTAPDEWIDKALDLVQKHKPVCWFLEAGVIRRAVEGFIAKRMRERRIYCQVEWVPSIADKEARGRAFQGRASMRTWHFPRGAPWGERVIDQCVAFPGGTFDDAFDVCSLFARMVDQAHPAVVPPPPKVEKDRWARAFKPEAAENWKTA